MRLQTEADNRNIKTIEWPKDDILFTKISIQNLKNSGNKILTKLDILLTDPIQMIHLDKEKQNLLSIYHNDPLTGGHCGRKKLYAKLKSKYYWKNLTRDVAKFVSNCKKCQVNKVRPGTKEEMVITPTPIKPFDILIIDTIGPLKESAYGNKYALTVICDLTKYLITISLPDKSAITIARAIFENVVLVYGIMKSIKTDCGTEYKNEMFKELCKFLRVDLNFSTPYHHESLGTVERNHRVFNEYLRAYLQETTFEDWDTYLKYFTFYHNTTTNSAFDNKYTPFELVFGKEPNLPSCTKSKLLEPVYNIDDYKNEVKYRLQKSHIIAKKLVEQNKLKNKKLFDRFAKPIDLNINDEILLQKFPYDKHKSIYEGPFLVKSINDVNITIVDKYSKKEKTVHKDRIRKL